jgi:hypothetical protein
LSVQIAGQIESRRESTLEDHAMKSFSRLSYFVNEPA